MSRRLLIAAGLIAPWCVLATQAEQASVAQVPELPAGVAARVGELEVRESDVLERAFEMEKSLPKNDQHIANAYQYLMEFALLRNEAKRLGVEISDDERDQATTRQIDIVKANVAERYSNVLTWDQWLREQSHTDTSFREFMRKQIDRFILIHRIVSYFQLTSPSATYSEMCLSRYEDALKLKQKLDAGEDFDTLALLNSVGDRQGRRVAFKQQGLPVAIETLLFDTLETGNHSNIVTVNEGDYRIVKLHSRFAGSDASYAELKDKLFDVYKNEGEISRERFDQWVAVMYNAGAYPVSYRFPGDKTKSTSTTTQKDVK